MLKANFVKNMEGKYFFNLIYIEKANKDNEYSSKSAIQEKQYCVLLTKATEKILDSHRSNMVRMDYLTKEIKKSSKTRNITRIGLLTSLPLLCCIVFLLVMNNLGATASCLFSIFFFVIYFGPKLDALLNEKTKKLRAEYKTIQDWEIAHLHYFS